MRKLIASTTIAASIVGAGAVIAGPGIAGAQDSDEAPQTEVETETGDQPGTSSLDAVLAPLVEDGTISEDQATAVAEAIEEARGERTHFRRGRLGARSFAKGEVLSELGIDAEALREGRAEGLTLGEIAEANGSSIDALTDALTAQIIEQLEAAVEAGRVTEERAAEIEAGIPERVEALVDGEARARGPRGRRGHHDHMGDTTDSATSADEAEETAA